jgi:O-antigen/teichoic acid export membrane protein
VSAPLEGASRLGTIRRAGWGIGDQALSSLTNFALAIAVARQVDTAGFGAFSIAFSFYLVALTVSRAISTDPLVIRFSRATPDTWRDATGAATGMALTIGILSGIGLMAIGALVGGDVGTALVAVGVGLPALLVQDAWRFAFFAAARGQSAFLNDLVWTVALVVIFALVFVSGERSVGMLVLAWGGGALVAAVFGVGQARTLPAIARARSWWRDHRDLAAPLALEGLILSGRQPLTLGIISLITSLAVVGTIRAGFVLMNGIHVATYGITLFGVPEGVRTLHRSTGALVRLCVVLAGGLMLVAAAWGIFLMLLPDTIGTWAMAGNWEAAQSVLLPMTVLTVATGAQAGALIGLRALAVPRRSLAARFVSSSLLFIGAVVGAVTGGAMGGAWGMAIGLVLGTAFWWWQLMRAVHAYSGGSTPALTPAPSGEPGLGQPG